MALTVQQKKFLAEYVHKHSIKGKGKTKRANGFSAVRQEVAELLQRAPSDLPGRDDLMRDMAAADELGDALKFNRAAEAMRGVLATLKQSMANYQPTPKPGDTLAGDPQEKQRLVLALNTITTDATPTRGWDRLTRQTELGGDLRILANQIKSKLAAPLPSAGALREAGQLLDELTVKRDFMVRREAEIEKRRRQLRKYATELENDQHAYRNHVEQQLASDAVDLADKDPWTPADETLATSLYLDMMLAVAERDNVDQTNFKEDSGTGEIVLAVKSKDGGSHKLVVKPMAREIPVDGFQAGGGASRELMGSVIGNKLQGMLGLDLDVPTTKLVQVDGGSIGMNQGEMVTASVQVFVPGGRSPKQEGIAAYRQVHGNPPPFMQDNVQAAADYLDANCDASEIQSKAVFDLISLHADRHMDNYLLDANNRLVPIDHGNILPTREGLRKRSVNMSTEAILANTAAAGAPMDEALIQRIERLNVDELIETVKTARRQMVQETPDADVGDLDEGISNMRRSTEFMKFAARRLTLKQIYKAYEICQTEIFCVDEQDKLQGFQQAIDALTQNGTDAGRLNQRYNLSRVKDQENLYQAMRDQAWFTYSMKADMLRFATKYPGRVLEMLDGTRVHPPMKVPPNLPQKPEDVGDNDWRHYWALGGDDAARRHGVSLQDDECRGCIGALEHALAVTGRMP